MKSKLDAWRKEYKVQSKEHPTLPKWAIKQVASDHVKKGRKMKGSIMDWFAAMSGLAVIAILYMAFTPIIYNNLRPLMDGVTNVDALNTMNLFDKVWNAWPIVFIIGFIIMVLVAAQRSKGAQGY
jgi:hypothetical protein